MYNFIFFNKYLLELRKQIKFLLGTIIFSSIISYFFVPKAIQIITRGVGKVVLLNPLEGFFVYLKVTLILGLFFSTPIIFYQIYKYLDKIFKEKKDILLFFWSSCILFFISLCVGYFLLLPIAIKFLLSFSSIDIIPVFSLDKYVSFIFILFFMSIIIMELPSVIFFLTKLGIISPELLKKENKHIILAIFVMAVIILPTINLFNLVMFACPMFLLYGFSIWLCKRISNKK